MPLNEHGFSDIVLDTTRQVRRAQKIYKVGREIYDFGGGKEKIDELLDRNLFTDEPNNTSTTRSSNVRASINIHLIERNTLYINAFPFMDEDERRRNISANLLNAINHATCATVRGMNIDRALEYLYKISATGKMNIDMVNNYTKTIANFINDLRNPVMKVLRGPEVASYESINQIYTGHYNEISKKRHDLEKCADIFSKLLTSRTVYPEVVRGVNQLYNICDQFISECEYLLLQTYQIMNESIR